MNITPLVSIVIPCYNSKVTLPKVIESIQRNKYKNYEVVIVDDGSDEPVDDVVASYKNNKIRLFRKKNEGLGLTRNFGIRQALGKYVFFLDADDEIFLNGLTRLVSFAESKQLTVVSGITVRHLLENGRREQWFPDIYKQDTVDELKQRNALYSDTLSTNKLYKKDMLLQQNILFEEGLYEDKLFTAKLYSSIDKIGLIHEEVYLWKVAPIGQSITQSKTVTNFEGRMDAILRLWQYLPELRKVYQIAFFANHDLLIYLREFKFYTIEEQKRIFDLASEFVVENKKYFYERLVPNSINFVCINALLKQDFDFFSQCGLVLSLEYYNK